MYTNKQKTRLEKSRRPLYWLKTKLLLIITAFMLGVSNSINEEKKTVFDHQYKIEHKDKKE
jgi:hypothetical protein